MRLVKILELGLCTRFLPGRDCTYRAVVFNCLELEKWLLNRTGNKIILLRDADCLRTRPLLNSSVVLRDLKSKSGHKNLVVDVQALNGVHGGRKERSAGAMLIDEALRRWGIKDKSKYPINLVKLSVKEHCLVPWPLAKYRTILIGSSSFISRCHAIHVQLHGRARGEDYPHQIH